MPVEVREKIRLMIRGEARFNSKNFGFNVLIKRLNARYKACPTPQELDACIGEAVAFCLKFKSALETEFDAIAKA